MAIVSLTLFHSANAVLSQGATRAFGGEFCAHCGSVALGTCPRRFVGLRSYNGPQTQQLIKEVTLLRDNPNRNANRKTKVNGQTPPFLVGRLRHDTYGRPDTLDVQVPVFNRQTCLREHIEIPVHLPTTCHMALRRYIRGPWRNYRLL